jgi:hypothetical protein
MKRENPLSNDQNTFFSPQGAAAMQTRTVDGMKGPQHYMITRRMGGTRKLQSRKQEEGADYGKIEAKLIKDLGKHYFNIIPPVNASVKVGLTYICGLLDKDTQLLQSRVWLHLDWNDNRLIWDPAEFAGLSAVRLPAWFLWLPDVTFVNTFTPAQIQDSLAVLFSTGDVLWIPPANIETLCRLDNNTQYTCKIEIASWMHTADQLPIKLNEYNDHLLMDYDPSCPATVSNPEIKLRVETYSVGEFQTFVAQFTYSPNTSA